jgi:uncharacterized membrane protein
MNLIVKKILTKEEMKNLAAVITEAEKKTSGEIRVVIRHDRQFKERKLELHQLALKQFYSLGMEKTRDKTGVLIFILLSERNFRIVADEGINAKVEDGTWNRIAETMMQYFRDAKYFDGIKIAVEAVANELSNHFPRKSDDANELSNEVVEH